MAINEVTAQLLAVQALKSSAQSDAVMAQLLQKVAAEGQSQTDRVTISAQAISLYRSGNRG